MTGENTIHKQIESMLVQNGHDILVDVNESFIFESPDGTEFRITYMMLSCQKGDPSYPEDAPERLRRLADAYDQSRAGKGQR